ncbi:hypothetical protein L6452_05743 [Arctium lappa]|uniref:Uncharacterized protein n=1 Tax=Arctium lappa TaxID=4217 RepID=A0ACB9EHA4_ARCLA|nr:hypothetical protein L6452_05743 [Arctium lappa]
MFRSGSKLEIGDKDTDIDLGKWGEVREAAADQRGTHGSLRGYETGLPRTAAVTPAAQGADMVSIGWKADVRSNFRRLCSWVKAAMLYVSHAHQSSHTPQTANFPNRGAIPTFKKTVETLKVQPS